VTGVAMTNLAQSKALTKINYCKENSAFVSTDYPPRKPTYTLVGCLVSSRK